jgi:hypothetical protein
VTRKEKATCLQSFITAINDHIRAKKRERVFSNMLWSIIAARSGSSNSGKIDNCHGRGTEKKCEIGEEDLLKLG